MFLEILQNSQENTCTRDSGKETHEKHLQRTPLIAEHIRETASKEIVNSCIPSAIVMQNSPSKMFVGVLPGYNFVFFSILLFLYFSSSPLFAFVEKIFLKKIQFDKFAQSWQWNKRTIWTGFRGKLLASSP